MRHYENKEELKAKIEKFFEKYIAEFEEIPEELKDYHCSEVDRSPAENLAYQIGWTTLLLQWEEDEKNECPVKTPSEDFKWNQLGDLYKWFTEIYADQSLPRLVDLFAKFIHVNTVVPFGTFRTKIRKWKKIVL